MPHIEVTPYVIGELCRYQSDMFFGVAELLILKTMTTVEKIFFVYTWPFYFRNHMSYVSCGDRLNYVYNGILNSLKIVLYFRLTG